MSTYHTEEQQLEDLKRFWKEHAVKILATAALIIAISAGFFYYQDKEKSHYEAGAVEYHKLLEMMEMDQEGGFPAIEKQAALLKAQYAKTPYAAASALLISKLTVDKGDLTETKAQLEWVILNAHISDFVQLAHARLARIFLAEKNYDAALKELEEVPGNRYESLYQEIRGDILAAMQKNTEARASYEAALNTMPSSAPEKKLVQMKYDNLAQPTDLLWSPTNVKEKSQESQ